MLPKWDVTDLQHMTEYVIWLLSLSKFPAVALMVTQTSDNYRVNSCSIRSFNRHQLIRSVCHLAKTLNPWLHLKLKKKNISGKKTTTYKQINAEKKLCSNVEPTTEECRCTIKTSQWFAAIIFDYPSPPHWRDRLSLITVLDRNFSKCWQLQWLSEEDEVPYSFAVCPFLFSQEDQIWNASSFFFLFEESYWLFISGKNKQEEIWPSWYSVDCTVEERCTVWHCKAKEFYNFSSTEILYIPEVSSKQHDMTRSAGD